MKFKIHREAHEDYFIVEGELLECQEQCYKEMRTRGWKHARSEQI